MVPQYSCELPPPPPPPPPSPTQYYYDHDPDQAMTTRCQSVFGIQELRSKVFLELDLPTLLVASRVCKSWAATIHGDPAIRRHLFYSFPLLRNHRDFYEDGSCGYKTRGTLLNLGLDDECMLRPEASWRRLQDPGSDVAIVRKRTLGRPPRAVREYRIRLVRGLTAGHVYALVWRHIGLAATRAYSQDRRRCTAHEPDGLLGCAARWLFLGGRGSGRRPGRGSHGSHGAAQDDGDEDENEDQDDPHHHHHHHPAAAAAALEDDSLALPAREQRALVALQRRLIEHDVATGGLLVLLDRCRACDTEINCRWCDMSESAHARSWADFALRDGPETAAADTLLQDKGWALALSLDFDRLVFAEGKGPLHLTSLSE